MISSVCASLKRSPSSISVKQNSSNRAQSSLKFAAGSEQASAQPVGIFWPKAFFSLFLGLISLSPLSVFGQSNNKVQEPKTTAPIASREPIESNLQLQLQNELQAPARSIAPEVEKTYSPADETLINYARAELRDAYQRLIKELTTAVKNKKANANKEIYSILADFANQKIIQDNFVSMFRQADQNSINVVRFNGVDLLWFVKENGKLQGIYGGMDILGPGKLEETAQQIKARHPKNTNDIRDLPVAFCLFTPTGETIDPIQRVGFDTLDGLLNRLKDRPKEFTLDVQALFEKLRLRILQQGLQNSEKHIN